MRKVYSYYTVRQVDATGKVHDKHYPNRNLRDIAYWRLIEAGAKHVIRKLRTISTTKLPVDI